MPRTVLICHHDAPLDREGLARWLASFTDLAGIVVVQETRRNFWRRVRREIRRIGVWRFLDVLLFRAYYRLRLKKKDQRWEREKLADLCQTYAALGSSTRSLEVSSPNAASVVTFLQELQPDLIIARCKAILKADVFEAARVGTLVMHPGVCPEYRNAHGCFWALARRDLERVGMTLLKIDRGIDTGPVFGHYGCRLDEVNDSHIVIQHKVVLENLDVLRDKILQIAAGTAERVDVTGRESREWGQPWLSAWLRWKRKARNKPDGRDA